MRYIIWIIALSCQLVWAHENDAPITESKPKVAVTVTNSDVSAKCKITHKGKETEGVDEQCTSILKDVFSAIGRQTQAEKK